MTMKEAKKEVKAMRDKVRVLREQMDVLVGMKWRPKSRTYITVSDTALPQAVEDMLINVQCALLDAELEITDNWKL